MLHSAISFRLRSTFHGARADVVTNNLMRLIFFHIELVGRLCSVVKRAYFVTKIPTSKMIYFGGLSQDVAYL